MSLILNYWLIATEFLVASTLLLYLMLLIDRFLYLRTLIDPKVMSWIRQVKPPKDWSCPIGLHPPEKGQVVVILPCGHSYIYDYIIEWFKQRRSCPLCRQLFNSCESRSELRD